MNRHLTESHEEFRERKGVPWWRCLIVGHDHGMRLRFIHPDGGTVTELHGECRRCGAPHPDGDQRLVTVASPIP